MHPYHLRALPQSLERDGDRARQPVGRLRRVADRADEALARGAEEDRAAEPVQEREAADQREVVRDRLAEADPRVDEDAGARDAGRLGRGDAGLEKVEDVEQHVVVGRRVLHGLRVAPRVHQADRPAGGGGDRRGSPGRG